MKRRIEEDVLTRVDELQAGQRIRFPWRGRWHTVRLTQVERFGRLIRLHIRMDDGTTTKTDLPADSVVNRRRYISEGNR